MSGQCLTKNIHPQHEIFNQFLVSPEKPSKTAQVTISKHDTDMTEPSLTMTTNVGSRPTKNRHCISEVATSYQPQFWPQPIEKHRQVSPTPDSSESPTPSSRTQTNTFRPNNLLNTPPATNTHSLTNINSVVQQV